MIEIGQSRDVITSYLEAVPDVIKRDHIEIHTSDRNLFRRCRRKWNWQSAMRENLVPRGLTATALWFGSGWHFLMEDYHGLRRFPTVDHAIVAYRDAFRKSELPPDIRDVLDLMAGMAHYYIDDWLVFHPEPYETLVIDGVPQVEVDIDVDITDILAEQIHEEILYRWLEHWGVNSVIYRMTMDRVVVDEHGVIYGLDYKTARQMDTNKLSNDPQVSAYDWGGAIWYGDMFGGMVWQQHFKGVPNDLEWLAPSGRFSTNKNQRTTYPIAVRNIKEHYGKIPPMYNEFLGNMAAQTSDAGDAFVRRDILRRNESWRRAEQEKIVAEVLDMINPELPLYPNPTRDCTWDCPFKDPCIALDDGSDLDFLLESAYDKWEGYKQDWKTRIVLPDGTPFYQENAA